MNIATGIKYAPNGYLIKVWAVAADQARGEAAWGTGATLEIAMRNFFRIAIRFDWAFSEEMGQVIALFTSPDWAQQVNAAAIARAHDLPATVTSSMPPEELFVFLKKAFLDGASLRMPTGGIAEDLDLAVYNYYYRAGREWLDLCLINSD